MSVFDSVRLNVPFRYRTEAQAALRKRQQPPRVNHCSPWKIRNLRKKIEILLTLRDSVSYCAAVVSAYGLVASLIDNLDGWDDWSYCETDSERRDAIRMYVKKAREMLDSARTAIESDMENGTYDGDTGKSALSYVTGSIDTARGIIDSISID